MYSKTGEPFAKAFGQAPACRFCFHCGAHLFFLTQNCIASQTHRFWMKNNEKMVAILYVWWPFFEVVIRQKRQFEAIFSLSCSVRNSGVFCIIEPFLFFLFHRHLLLCHDEIIVNAFLFEKLDVSSELRNFSVFNYAKSVGMA